MAPKVASVPPSGSPESLMLEVGAVALVVGGGRRMVPLSQQVRYAPNRKKKDSNARTRYASYSSAKTLRQALCKGSKVGDLRWDLQNKHLELIGYEAPVAPVSKKATLGHALTHRQTSLVMLAAAPKRAPADAAGEACTASLVRLLAKDTECEAREAKRAKEGGSAAAGAGEEGRPAEREPGRVPELAGCPEPLARTSLLGPSGPPAGCAEPFAHSLSFGSRCVIARVMQDMQIRRYAGPFDWVYSSAEMVRDCMANDFENFLDTDQIQGGSSSCSSSSDGVGHSKYGPMLKRSLVFPHHRPDTKESDRILFERMAQRFRLVTASARRKLFVLGYPVCSKDAACGVRQTPGGGSSLAEVRKLFSNLQERGIQNFELLVVYIMQAGASDASHVPDVREVLDLGSGGERLLAFELHCLGKCSGLNFKDDADEQALRSLLRGRTGAERQFALEPDPLPPRLGDGPPGSGRRKMGEVVEEPGAPPPSNAALARIRIRSKRRLSGTPQRTLLDVGCKA
eukprot:CAMPEP_0177165282 /NCGR_PEP_ID=MMETSP0367-20130122/7411_1 /TAXON_ID=447022 ORGANISM="Scrippsiella hangoei-like, Strain SHHI-4" /NCGR_SAMPLE_ID=MMETSP0367 /ASSEMBLY_ACC=CAM_ASM_000362 /LENGTH=512 /DNA_ID=CAMNT_0018611261 /DNA_START=62 /DNA_END=1597 /DNA_ORIENTATION=+